MRRQLSRYLCAITVAGAVAGCGTVTPQGQTAPPPATPAQRATAAPTNPDSASLADFNARLDRYIRLQRELAADSLPLKETKDPQDIVVAQELLAAKIRNVRKNAMRGDIFAPQVAEMFKRLLTPPLTGRTRQETRETLEEEDGEVAQVWLKVNATWPATEPLTTVPPNILERLPQLPMDVEHRITAKRHLVLRDVDANVIVDFIYNALR